MKKKLKKTVMFLIICFALTSLNVSAADERLGTVVDGSLLTEGTQAEFIVTPRARGSYLSNGTGGFKIVSGKTYNVYGTTSCYQSVDQVKVKLYLQRLEGNTWVSVSAIPTKTAYNTYYVSKSINKTVTGGYYYRVFGSHTAVEGSTTESLSSFTNGLYVN